LEFTWTTRFVGSDAPARTVNFASRPLLFNLNLLNCFFENLTSDILRLIVCYQKNVCGIFLSEIQAYNFCPISVCHSGSKIVIPGLFKSNVIESNDFLRVAIQGLAIRLVQG
jgi:hypothetical protein